MAKLKLTIPVNCLAKRQLHFEIRGERDGTFTVLDRTLAPIQVRFTGFSDRAEAERFVQSHY